MTLLEQHHQHIWFEIEKLKKTKRNQNDDVVGVDGRVLHHDDDDDVEFGI